MIYASCASIKMLFVFAILLVNILCSGCASEVLFGIYFYSFHTMQLRDYNYQLID